MILMTNMYKGSVSSVVKNWEYWAFGWAFLMKLRLGKLIKFEEQNCMIIFVKIKV